MDATLAGCNVAALKSADGAEKTRAWVELYNATFASIYRFACRNGALPADAEEITQKTYLIAYRKLSENPSVDNITSWLYGIAIRVVREHYRWQRIRRLKAWMLPSSAGATPSEPKSPETTTEGAILHIRIHQVLSAMSSKLREVLVLVDIEDLDLQEAAKVLQIPVNTVRSRRRLAHEDFRRRWLALTAEGARYD
jgi:RNA polymerase sigma-70 factor (ECF subfamily)